MMAMVNAIISAAQSTHDQPDGTRTPTALSASESDSEGESPVQVVHTPPSLPPPAPAVAAPASAALTNADNDGEESSSEDPNARCDWNGRVRKSGRASVRVVPFVPPVEIVCHKAKWLPRRKQGGKRAARAAVADDPTKRSEIVRRKRKSSGKPSGKAAGKPNGKTSAKKQRKSTTAGAPVDASETPVETAGDLHDGESAQAEPSAEPAGESAQAEPSGEADNIDVLSNEAEPAPAAMEL